MDGYFIAFFLGCAAGGIALFAALAFDIGMDRVEALFKRFF